MVTEHKDLDELIANFEKRLEQIEQAIKEELKQIKEDSHRKNVI